MIDEQREAIRARITEEYLVRGRPGLLDVTSMKADIATLLAEVDRLRMGLQYVLEDDGCLPRAHSKCRAYVKDVLNHD